MCCPCLEHSPQNRFFRTPPALVPGKHAPGTSFRWFTATYQSLPNAHQPSLGFGLGLGYRPKAAWLSQRAGNPLVLFLPLMPLTEHPTLLGALVNATLIQREPHSSCAPSLTLALLGMRAPTGLPHSMAACVVNDFTESAPRLLPSSCVSVSPSVCLPVYLPVSRRASRGPTTRTSRRTRSHSSTPSAPCTTACGSPPGWLPP